MKFSYPGKSTELGRDTIFATCSSYIAPLVGEYVYSICKDATNSTAESNFRKDRCTEPPPNFYVTAPCIQGNESTVRKNDTSVFYLYTQFFSMSILLKKIGLDTQFFPCQFPENNTYISSLCNYGSSTVPGSNSIVSMCDAAPSSNEYSYTAGDCRYSIF